MKTNVLDYLEDSEKKYSDKMAYVDEKEGYSFGKLKAYGQSMATGISDLNFTHRPIVIYMDKSVKVLASFMGVLYSGNFYCPIDTQMPAERIDSIFNVLKPIAVIVDGGSKDKFNSLKVFEGPVLSYESLISTEVDFSKLDNIRSKMLGTDPVYVLFTSGSTGVPKGVVVCHYSIIDFADWMSNKFNITSDDNFGNQSPLYFDLSIGDLFCTLKQGCTNYLIPKELFGFPFKLIQYLNEKRINIIFWIPSALCLIANLRTFKKIIPEYLDRVLFCGEVMPNKQLNMWRKALPNTLFANLYGPCEATDASTYYIVDREFSDDESLPIGFPCENTEIIVINEEGKPVEENEIGELYIKGIGLALGYYNNPQKTKEAFVQNPLHNDFIDITYKTGDLVKYNKFGELEYVSRKDYQIKHMGYRIELGEIETAMNYIPSVETAVCIYDDIKKKIVMFYSGEELDFAIMNEMMRNRVPEYMVPAKYIHVNEFPHNQNGKIDRKLMKEQYEEIKRDE